MGADPYTYAGQELDLFREATRWKSYLAGRLRPFIGGDVLEVGAGLGGTTPFLVGGHRSWTCLEPDPSLAARLPVVLEREPRARPWRVVTGTLDTLEDGESLDSILYVDVLEHIGDDRSELRKAAEHLKPGGRLIVLAPAHMWLYSEFDRSIGHHRRYSAHVLRAVGPPQPQIRAAFYLDSFGMLASAANRALLRSDMPTAGQLRFWDRWLVRVSRWLDPLLGYRLGKTVVVVWAR